MLGWFWALHSQGGWQREKWLGSESEVGAGGHCELRWERPGLGGSEHPGWALHPTQGQEGGSSVVPAGPAGQWDRQSGKGSCHTEDSGKCKRFRGQGHEAAGLAEESAVGRNRWGCAGK